MNLRLIGFGTCCALVGGLVSATVLHAAPPEVKPAQANVPEPQLKPATPPQVRIPALRVPAALSNDHKNARFAALAKAAGHTGALNPGSSVHAYPAGVQSVPSGIQYVNGNTPTGGNLGLQFVGPGYDGTSPANGSYLMSHAGGTAHINFPSEPGKLYFLDCKVHSGSGGSTRLSFARLGGSGPNPSMEVASADGHAVGAVKASTTGSSTVAQIGFFPSATAPYGDAWYGCEVIKGH